MSHQSTPLTEDQVTSFHSEGYLVVEDLLTSEEVTSFVEYEAQGDQPGPRGLQNHKIDAQWAHLAHHPRVAGIVRQLCGPTPRIVQTILHGQSPFGRDGRGPSSGHPLHPQRAQHADGLLDRPKRYGRREWRPLRRAREQSQRPI